LVNDTRLTVGLGVVQERNVISASADGCRLPRLNSLHPLVVGSSVSTTVSTFSRLWIHCIHIQSFVDSLNPHSVGVDTLNPLYPLYPLNPLYPHSVTPGYGYDILKSLKIGYYILKISCSKKGMEISFLEIFGYRIGYKYPLIYILPVSGLNKWYLTKYVYCLSLLTSLFVFSSKRMCVIRIKMPLDSKT
jgi:hypothetical protein